MTFSHPCKPCTFSAGWLIRNNQKEFLAEEDYHHIFETLYGEKVDILGDVEKDFSRTLVYVPNMK